MRARHGDRRSPIVVVVVVVDRAVENLPTPHGTDPDKRGRSSPLRLHQRYVPRAAAVVVAREDYLADNATVIAISEDRPRIPACCYKPRNTGKRRL